MVLVLFSVQCHAGHSTWGCGMPHPLGPGSRDPRWCLATHLGCYPFCALTANHVVSCDVYCTRRDRKQEAMGGSWTAISSTVAGDPTRRSQEHVAGSTDVFALPACRSINRTLLLAIITDKQFSSRGYFLSGTHNFPHLRSKQSHCSVGLLNISGMVGGQWRTNINLCNCFAGVFPANNFRFLGVSCHHSEHCILYGGFVIARLC